MNAKQVGKADVSPELDRDGLPGGRLIQITLDAAVGKQRRMWTIDLPVHYQLNSSWLSISRQPTRLAIDEVIEIG